MDIKMFVVTLLIAGLACSVSRQSGDGNRAMRLVWSDEFEYQGLPDSSKWGYDHGDGCPDHCGWGNHELQYYTSRRAENARVEKGLLIIEAHREPMQTKEYSSARLISKHKGDWTYGRFVVRAKLPSGKGVWPAIWMLPTDWAYGEWPASGEIDIMENVGYKPDSIFGTIHTDRFNHRIGTQVSRAVWSPDLSSRFHEYAVEWNQDRIDFYFDGKKYQTFRNMHDGPGAWPFDKRFHLLMNIAVGGDWGGQQGVDTAIWPQRMEIDYVRVYQR